MDTTKTGTELVAEEESSLSEMEVSRAEAREIEFISQQTEWAYRQACNTIGDRHLSLHKSRSLEKKLETLGTPEQVEQTAKAPPWQVSWLDMDGLCLHDPDQARDRWEEIKTFAKEELEGGYRAAQVALVIGGTGPYALARFRALRESLTRDWQPQNGIEQLLIDQMVQAQTCYEHWLHVCMRRSTVEVDDEEPKEDGEGDVWKGPRVGQVEAIEQAMLMADRFQRMFLRSQRALRDMRRYAPSVVVQNAGQVNVGAQQVNMAHTSPELESSAS